MVEGQKQETRGGFRAGAGRKPGPKTSLSAHQVAQMLRKARKAAKKHGKDVDDVLIEFIYDEKLRAADRLASIKLFKEYTAPKISEGGVADKENAPAVFLPSQRPVLAAADGKKVA
jgi:hypothetical protein